MSANHPYTFLRDLPPPWWTTRQLQEGSRLFAADVNPQSRSSTQWEGLAVEPLRHHLPVHDGDVDEEEQDDEEVVHEAQQAKQRLRQDVQRRGQVGERAHQAKQDADAEHPEEAADREHLPEGMAEQGGYIPQPVHQLWRRRRRRGRGGGEIIVKAGSSSERLHAQDTCSPGVSAGAENHPSTLTDLGWPENRRL